MLELLELYMRARDINFSFFTDLRRCEISQEIKIKRCSLGIAGSLLMIAGPHQSDGGSLKLAGPT